jgi:hypothetical protein
VVKTDNVWVTPITFSMPFTFGTPTFTIHTPAQHLRIWTGTEWYRGTTKQWNGSAWVDKPLKAWTGSVWK